MALDHAAAAPRAAAAVPGADLPGLLLACPPDWQDYISACSNTAVAVLRGFPAGKAPDGRACLHKDFGCFVKDHYARDACQRQCMVGVTLALLSLFIQTLQSGKVDEAAMLVTSLQHIRIMLPANCHGEPFESGCEPVLPTGWFASAFGLLQDVTGHLADLELRPARHALRLRASGRRLAVVTAYWPDPKIWRWAGDADGPPSNSSRRGVAIPMRWYLKNKQCYADKHGYSFIFRRQPPEVKLDAHLDGYGFTIHWIKLAAVREALRRHDWVFWIDYDSLFGNMSQTLEEFIDIAEQQGSVDLIVQDGPQLICPNAFLLRSSAWAFNFLDNWERFGRMAIHGRSKMWELRCFNCAVVDHVLTAKVGKTLRNCGETASHVHLLRHLLDKHGFSWYARKETPALGKVYFWNAAEKGLRGFLFNVNDPEQQRFFSQADLYHPGDLAIHWPGPKKDTDVMRDFANEVTEAEGCDRWLQPRVALEEAYRPIGAADAPALFAPRHVLRAFVRFPQAEAAVRTDGSERSAVLQLLLDELVGRRAIIDVFLGKKTSEEERQAAWRLNNLRLRAASSMRALPQARVYDFIYIGKRVVPLPDCAAGGPPADGAACPRTGEDELLLEVYEGLARLRPGGVLVVPLSGCGAQGDPPWDVEEAWLQETFSEASIDASVVWRQTREFAEGDVAFATRRINEFPKGCRWAYAQNLVNDSVYRFGGGV